ncbi:MAG: energy-coupling factor transporter transmembrane component T [Caldilineales bacterium]
MTGRAGSRSRGERRGPPIHPGAWVGWLLVAVAALLSTRNPVYLAVILLCIAATLRTGRALAFSPRFPLSLWRFGLLVVTLSAAFNGLMAHFGATVLFTLPAGLPLIGGAVTLEAVVYGALNGLVLTGMFAAFLALYQATPTYALIRLIPRALYPVGVVVSVAVAYVPTTLDQFGQIREAQRLRGHQVRGVRDWLPLAMPLLVTGLERAMQLAEAMTARGFGNLAETQPARHVARGLVVFGLIVLAGGVGGSLLGAGALSTALIAAGGLAVVAALWLQGRGVRRTSFRPQPWTRRDWAVVAGALLVAALYLLPLPGVDHTSLAYSPYPRLSTPGVSWPIAIGTLGLAVPALVLAVTTRKHTDRRAPDDAGPVRVKWIPDFAESGPTRSKH